MRISEIVKTLDDYFRIDKLPVDLPFSKTIPNKSKAKGINYEMYLEKNYMSNFHGLMLRNGDTISQVIGTVFLDRGVLDQLINEGVKDALIFSHHPVEDQTSGEGFIPLTEEYYEKLRRNRISVYSIHTPLDRHDTISTKAGMLKALKLKPAQDKEHSVTIGEYEAPILFEDFIAAAKKAFDIDKVNYQKKKTHVQKVGIVPGGGTDFKYIKAANSECCDTYISGEYYNKLQMEWGDYERGVFDKNSKGIEMNFVEVSHYASEKAVFVNLLPEFFRKLELPYRFVEQSDPWY